jgi:hypothetical protein
MDKLSRLRILGQSYTERVDDLKNGAKILGNKYREHMLTKYPKTEVDSEGVMLWESPKKCKMIFHELTPEQGYIKTVDKFNKYHVNEFVRIYIDGVYVVVEWS